MTDCFALLGQPRRPHLDAEILKEKYHQLTAAHHPDVATDDRIDFAAINNAYNKLRDPRARLRHLLELEFPDLLSRPQQIPTTIAELFMQTGVLSQRLDVFLKKRKQAASPLAVALLETEKLALLEDFEIQRGRINEHHAPLLKELRALDAGWPRNKTGVANRLAEIFQGLSFLSKWSEQLREGVMKLDI